MARRTHLRLDLGGLALLRSGGDPIVLRKAKKAASRGVPTFGQLGHEVIEGKSTEWRNEKHRRQWKMTLVEYAATIRSRPVNEIETEDVLGVRRSLWLKAPGDGFTPTYRAAFLPTLDRIVFEKLRRPDHLGPVFIERPPLLSAR